MRISDSPVRLRSRCACRSHRGLRASRLDCRDAGGRATQEQLPRSRSYRKSGVPGVVRPGRLAFGRGRMSHGWRIRAPMDGFTACPGRKGGGRAGQIAAASAGESSRTMRISDSPVRLRSRCACRSHRGLRASRLKPLLQEIRSPGRHAAGPAGSRRRAALPQRSESRGFAAKAAPTGWYAQRSKAAFGTRMCQRRSRERPSRPRSCGRDTQAAAGSPVLCPL